MYELKTKPTKVTVASYIAAIEDDERRRDCKAIVSMMKRVTGATPKMWGPSIVGFGSYHYTYDSGHEGDMAAAGFSSRRGDITVYLSGFTDARTRSLLKDLGKHRTGKVCLYFKRLADVKMPVLEKLVADSYADVKRRYPKTAK